MSLTTSLDMSCFEQRGIKPSLVSMRVCEYAQYEQIQLELPGPAAAQEAEIVEGES